MITFTPPPADPELNPKLALIVERTNTALEHLANDMGQLCCEIAERPLHNEKEARVERLAGFLEAASKVLRDYARSQDRYPTIEQLEVLLGSLEQASIFAKDLRAENAIHPASIIGRPLRAAEG